MKTLIPYLTLSLLLLSAELQTSSDNHDSNSNSSQASLSAVSKKRPFQPRASARAKPWVQYSIEESCRNSDARFGIQERIFDQLIEQAIDPKLAEIEAIKIGDRVYQNLRRHSESSYTNISDHNNQLAKGDAEAISKTVLKILNKLEKPFISLQPNEKLYISLDIFSTEELNSFTNDKLLTQENIFNQLIEQAIDPKLAEIEARKIGDRVYKHLRYNSESYKKYKPGSTNTIMFNLNEKLAKNDPEAIATTVHNILSDLGIPVASLQPNKKLCTKKDVSRSSNSSEANRAILLAAINKDTDNWNSIDIAELLIPSEIASETSSASLTDNIPTSRSSSNKDNEYLGYLEYLYAYNSNCDSDVDWSDIVQ